MSHSHLEHPPNGEDLEAKGDLLDEERTFMPGIGAAEYINEHLDDHGQGTKMSWAVIFLLQGFNIDIDPKTQDLLLQNIKQAYECLHKEK